MTVLLPSLLGLRDYFPILAMQWLTAVELGLLKGRHPLLKDVDVTVNPSKGLVLSEAIAPEKGITAKKLPQVARGEVVNGYHVDPSGGTLEDSDITTNSSLPSGTELEKNVKVETGSDEPENGGVSTNGPVEVEDEVLSVEESERGQMLQTTEVVVKMLDVTMPGTLKAEEKKKVTPNMRKLLFKKTSFTVVDALTIA